MAARPETGSRYVIALGMCLAIGALLRLWRLGDTVVIDDEWHALNAVAEHGAGWIFSHFGRADYSIPLALAYEAMQHSIGLSEWTLRLPLALAGIATIGVLPRLMRPWLNHRERLLMAALLALSPFLVNFSRIARPYALLALLAGASLPLAWRWWRENHVRAGTAWVFCAVAAGWLNPVSLAVTTAPFLWFCADALRSALSGRGARDLGRVTLAGLAIALPLTGLLWLPLANDFASLAVKSGLHRMTLDTVAVMLGLYTGSAHAPVVMAAGLLAVLGGWVLWRRDAAFARYLLLVTCAAGVAVWASGAEWIHQGLVPARYLIGLLPILLALTALGAWALAGRMQDGLGMPKAAAGILVAAMLLGWAGSGPIPEWNLRHSQFPHHLTLQFDFDPARNDFSRVLAPVRAEPFYAEIAAANPEGDALVVEAPWFLESHWNPLPIYQAAHGQRVSVAFIGGVCAGKLYGELDPGVPGLRFRHFLRLSELLRNPELADYLVLRRAGLEGARDLPMEFESCAAAARTAFGPPWRETPTALVFRLKRDA